MNKEMTSQAEADEQILTSDVPDDVLERAASGTECPHNALLHYRLVQLRFAADCSVLAHQLRQLGDVRRDPPGLDARLFWMDQRSGG